MKPKNTKSKPWAFRDRWPTVDWDKSNSAIAAQLDCSTVAVFKARRVRERHIAEIIRGLPGCIAYPDGTVSINRKLQPVLFDAVLDNELDCSISAMLESGVIKIVGQCNGEPLYELLKI